MLYRNMSIYCNTLGAIYIDMAKYNIITALVSNGMEQVGNGSEAGR